MGVGTFAASEIRLVKSEETPSSVVKRFLAVRVCALRKHEFPSVHVRASFDQPSGCPYVDFSRLHSHLAFGFLFLDAFNRSLEPASQFWFQFFLSTKPVERIDCFSPFVEGNVAAGKFIPLHVLRH